MKAAEHAVLRLFLFHILNYIIVIFSYQKQLKCGSESMRCLNKKYTNIMFWNFTNVTLHSSYNLGRNTYS